MQIESVSSQRQELKSKDLVRHGTKADGSSHQWWVVTDAAPTLGRLTREVRSAVPGPGIA